MLCHDMVRVGGQGGVSLFLAFARVCHGRNFIFSVACMLAATAQVFSLQFYACRFYAAAFSHLYMSFIYHLILRYIIILAFLHMMLLHKTVGVFLEFVQYTVHTSRLAVPVHTVAFGHVTRAYTSFLHLYACTHAMHYDAVYGALAGRRSQSAWGCLIL